MYGIQTVADGSLYVTQNTTTALSFTGYAGTTNVTTIIGWIVMQQRIDASVDFNQNIYQLTGSGGWMLTAESRNAVECQ